MKKPKFYCTQFIDCNSNIKKYQPPDCKEQCNACMDIIIDHHFNKKPQLKIMDITTKQAVDKLTAELKKDPDLYYAYQSNIAMAIYDTFFTQYGGYYDPKPTVKEMHDAFNEGAKRFLNILCDNYHNDEDLQKTGATLIAEERAEQIIKHNWTPEHDDNLTSSELTLAAVACLMLDADVTEQIYDHSPMEIWPWRTDPYFTNICLKSRIDQLRVAGAFIAAEIDRLQRIK